MPNLKLFDANFRPRSYFVTEPEIALLSRIKGAERRKAVRELGLDGVSPEVCAQSLNEEDRRAAGAIHPSLMGGEYLPDLAEDEVEIARFELKSVTADVISLRARWKGGRIRYRMVDEYDEKFYIKPKSSGKPLTFRQLVKLIDLEAVPDIVRDYNFYGRLDRGTAERMVNFVRVTSEFYPELESYYGIQADEWFQEKLTELEERASL